MAEGRIDRAPGDGLAAAARAAGILDDADLERLAAADRARDQVIQVDVFAPDAFPARAS